MLSRGVVYQIYPRSFFDTNGDGVGDIPGMVAKLDHLAWLGVDALWTSPTFRSPNVDWGYDVSDYNSVHPDLGTMDDLDTLIAEARKRNIEVWLDLVPNHTSDRHEWFAERPEYYVWSKTIPNDWKSIFTKGSAWHWDARRKSYYLHQFAPQQPDLDWWNFDVRAEFERIIRFWFDRGVAGYRIDVAHGLVNDRELRDGIEHMRERPEVHDIYRSWQEIAREYDPKPTLMGETVVKLEKMLEYYKGLDIAQNFDFCGANFTLGELRPIVEKTMNALPPGAIPNWFGGNHDHPRLASRWAGGDECKARAVLFLILTLPGVAILYQGDEIALEDGVVSAKRRLDIADPSRDPERTPLPWTRGGDEWRDPWLPLGDTSRNVEDQRADESSTLHYVRDLIRAAKELGDGYETLPSPRGVWAYRRGERTCVLNMSGRRATYDGSKLEPWEGVIV